MSLIYLANHAHDGDAARLLASAIRRSGHRVLEAAIGKDWRRAHTEVLQEAEVVIVLWSASSTGSDGGLVREEAERARARDVLLGVRIGKVDVPLGFGESPTFDLFDWGGSPGSRSYKRIVEAAKAIAAGHRAPVRKPAHRWRWLLGIGPVVVAAIGFFADVAGLQSLICRAPGIHSVCAVWELGGVPSPEEQRSWDGLTKGECPGLRAHLSHFPNGAFAGEAQARLAAIRYESVERWEGRTRQLPLATSSPVELEPNEEAARRVASKMAEREAADLCRMAAQEGKIEVEKVSATGLRHICRRWPEGFTCRVDGTAECLLRQQAIEQREVCP